MFLMKCIIIDEKKADSSISVYKCNSYSLIKWESNLNLLKI